MLNEKCMFAKIDFITFYTQYHTPEKKQTNKASGSAGRKKKNIEAIRWILLTRTYYYLKRNSQTMTSSQPETKVQSSNYLNTLTL